MPARTRTSSTPRAQRSLKAKTADGRAAPEPSRAVAAQGAELAFSYQGEALKKRVGPLAAQLGSDIVLPCDVADVDSVDGLFSALKERWGQMDFLVHAIAFSNKDELTGRFVNTSRTNFKHSLAGG